MKQAAGATSADAAPAVDRDRKVSVVHAFVIYQNLLSLSLRLPQRKCARQR